VPPRFRRVIPEGDQSRSGGGEGEQIVVISLNILAGYPWVPRDGNSEDDSTFMKHSTFLKEQYDKLDSGSLTVKYIGYSLILLNSFR
jgi:hypothetical protein